MSNRRETLNKKACKDLRNEAARWMDIIYDHLVDVGMVPGYNTVKKTAHVAYALERLAREIGAIKDEDGPWDILLETPLSGDPDY